MATDKETDKRLIKTYGITLIEYESMLRDQGGGCAICGREPTTKRLHVDHDHAFDRVKLVTLKTEVGWNSSTPEGFVPWVTAFAKTKSLAIKAAKHQLKRLSVRGLLCWSDNTALQKYRDDPERMEAAARYLRKFNGNK
jgi:hypothetical protein